jgi:hypothetical protein
MIWKFLGFAPPPQGQPPEEMGPPAWTRPVRGTIRYAVWQRDCRKWPGNYRPYGDTAKPRKVRK